MLDPIVPAVDGDGIIDLNWSDIVGATTYYVFRDTSNITSVVGLTPIASVSESNYTDTLTINGIYHYVIVVEDGWANSSISNCEDVTVGIPLSATFLYPILPEVDEDGIIELEWSKVVRATIYYVYRSLSYISSLDGLIPIAMVSETNYTDTLTANDYYYYVIVAGDGWRNSSISNCHYVLVAISSGDGDGISQPDYTLFFILIIIAGFAIAGAIIVHGFLVRARPSVPPTPPKKAPPAPKKP